VPHVDIDIGEVCNLHIDIMIAPIQGRRRHRLSLGPWLPGRSRPTLRRPKGLFRALGRRRRAEARFIRNAGGVHASTATSDRVGGDEPQQYGVCHPVPRCAPKERPVLRTAKLLRIATASLRLREGRATPEAAIDLPSGRA
jgi:hypothetical protein